MKRLDHPLTNSKNWIELDGTSDCKPIWNGLSNFDELELDGPSGHVEGLTLRLYNPKSHQWSLYWGDSKGGTLPPPPTVGSFDTKNGRGEFYDQEPFDGRMIFVRFVWSDITPTSAHFEESFSEDGGKTWEVWWVTDQVRVQK